MDRLTKERRSWLMGRVKAKDTKPELAVRSLVHRLGFRFRLHYKKLPGKPDLAFPGRKKVIFVHGCFWHGHSCPKGRLPKTNIEAWTEKIVGNKERDHRTRERLREAGWDSLVVWQCETRELSALKLKLLSFLAANAKIRSRRT